MMTVMKMISDIRWEEIPPMSFARASPAVAASNGKIYAIGAISMMAMAIVKAIYLCSIDIQVLTSNGKIYAIGRIFLMAIVMVMIF